MWIAIGIIGFAWWYIIGFLLFMDICLRIDPIYRWGDLAVNVFSGILGPFNVFFYSMLGDKTKMLFVRKRK